MPSRATVVGGRTAEGVLSTVVEGGAGRTTGSSFEDGAAVVGGADLPLIVLDRPWASAVVVGDGTAAAAPPMAAPAAADSVTPVVVEVTESAMVVATSVCGPPVSGAG